MQLTVGQSSESDGFNAGETAAEQAMAEDAACVYVFAASTYDLAAVAEGVAGVAGDLPVVGCSSTIEVTGDGIARDSVVVGVVSGEGIDVGVGIGTDIDADSHGAGKTAIRDAVDGLAADEVAPYRQSERNGWRQTRNLYVNIFADPLHGVGADVLEGINDFLGPGYSVTGEFAADDMQFEQTHVFYNGDVYENAVVCCVLQSDASVGSARRHGFTPTPNQFTVTDSEQAYVKAVDERPPASVYADIFGEEKAHDPAFLLMAPFGLKDHNEDEYRLRVTLDVDNEGCYHCGASVPKNANVTLMMGEKKNLLDAAETAAEEAMADAGLDEESVGGALVFSCVARDAIYDDPALTDQEIANVREHLGEDTPIIGLYGFGQIATSRGWTAFNEETMAIQVFGR